MDYSTIIIELLKDKDLRNNLNPILYYSLKMIYKSSFKRRSKIFTRAMRRLFETLGETMDVSLFGESIIENMDINNSITIEMNNEQENQTNMNISVNRDYFMNMSKLFTHSWEQSLDLLIMSEESYILDNDDDYILIKLIRAFLLSEEEVKSSQLFTSYHIFCSSIEMIFCMKLAERLPCDSYNPRERYILKAQVERIEKRCKLFYSEWAKLHYDKYDKNMLIKRLLGDNAIIATEESQFIDFTGLTMVEPLLNSKYASFTKLIKEGPFCYEIEEVARQLCLIDHEAFCTLNLTSFDKFIISRELPESFNKYDFREKQLKCYIILFILMHNNLENKKTMIQNFITLAYTCKLLNNQQTSYTIIAAFNLVGITRRTLLWKMIEKKYRDLYASLEKDFGDLDINDNNIISINSDKIQTETFACVPHANRIKNTLNNFILRMRSADIEEKLKISKEYKDFTLAIISYHRLKYSFFKVNPLNDFLSFGFLEIFKPRKWNLKLRMDLSEFTQNLDQLDQLMEFLIANFKKLHN